MDCDGVLTDGHLYFSPSGEELKVFHVRDGQGLVMWHAAGFRSAIISGRNSPIVELRGTQLGVEFIVQGCNDKTVAFNEILMTAGLTSGDVVFIGDDTPDLEVMKLSGMAIAVGDAEETVKASADYVTKAFGGLGAVREVIDLILGAKQN
jgi:3-deoxy-D-manno-octulosonate 8-phosphate phosphatase (KDO 8-P phosphatase)